jgi:hypothetical protein
MSKTDPVRVLARKMAGTLRHKAPFPGVLQFVHQVVAHCGGKSVVSGEDDLGKLCVVLLDEDTETWNDPNNAVLVTQGESWFLSLCNDRRALLWLLKRPKEN